MSNSNNNNNSLGLNPPPSPVLTRDEAPKVVPTYLAQHTYAPVPLYENSVSQILLTPFLGPIQFGAENTFGPPEIKPEDITYDVKYDHIGGGSYGTVYKARCRGMDVAVKIPHNQQLSIADLKSFEDEVQIMSKNTHPNIIRMMGACTTQGKLQIVTERCVGDLERLLDDPNYSGSLYDRLKLARDTAKGMTWLHEVTKIIHGDLKPANLLIDINGQVKITDFGFSQFKGDRPLENRTTRGTLIWMAPEKILRQPITDKVDVFSFGIILWEMATRQKPYQNHSDPQLFCRAVCFDKERPQFSVNIPHALRNLIETCWHDKAENRCSFREIIYRLNVILVDLAIEIPPAANFWKSKFINRENFENVEWTDFRNALKQEIGAFDDIFFEYMKPFLVEKIQEGGRDCECVTMKRFDKVTKWFGPFFMPEPGPAIINEVNELCKNDWFHGDITSERANGRLSDKPAGTFLIRLSNADPLRAPFSLSMPGNKHTHIQRTHEGLQVQKAAYPSLENFVQKNSNVLKFASSKVDKTFYTDNPIGALYL